MKYQNQAAPEKTADEQAAQNSLMVPPRPGSIVTGAVGVQYETVGICALRSGPHRTRGCSFVSRDEAGRGSPLGVSRLPLKGLLGTPSQPRRARARKFHNATHRLG